MAKFEEKRLLGLGGLATAIHWFEELLSTVNGIALMIGAGIAVTDLLTDGLLSRASVLFVFAWAVSQAVGIEVQLLGSFARARQAKRNGETGAMLGWLMLGIILLGVTFIAGYVYSLVRADNISTEAALNQLGISNFAFLGVRAFLAAGLVALSGWTRYVGKPKVLRSAEEEVAAIERQRKIEAAKSKLSRQRAANAVKFGRSAINAAFSREEVETEEDGENDNPKSLGGTSEDNAGEVPARETSTRKRGKKPVVPLARYRKRRENGSAEKIVHDYLDRHPGAKTPEIRGATGLAKNTVLRWSKTYKARESGFRAGAKSATR